MSIRGLVAHTSPAMRAGICTAMAEAATLDVVGEASCTETLLQLCAQRQPEVLLLDWYLPILGGMEVVRRLQGCKPVIRVLVSNAADDDRCIREVLRTGTAGYVVEDESLGAIVSAVKAVARGQVWYSQRVMAKIAAYAREGARESPLVTELTAREREVLQLLAQGMTNKRIAVALCITLQTVKNHVSSIYGKLGVCSRVEAAMRAVERGPVTWDKLRWNCD